MNSHKAAMASRVGDTLTRAGSERLADAIQDYWHLRGQEVYAEPVESKAAIVVNGTPMRVWTVRSDMVNGLPREYRPTRAVKRL